MWLPWYTAKSGRMGGVKRKPPHEGNEQHTRQLKRARSSNRAAETSELVPLETLRWSKVSIPKLDDAEGFFELEEISDVEVVKDGSGALRYRVCPLVYCKNEYAEKSSKHRKRIPKTCHEVDQPRT